MDTQVLLGDKKFRGIIITTLEKYAHNKQINLSTKQKAHEKVLNKISTSKNISKIKIH